MSSKIVHIESAQQFSSLLSSSRIVVTDFYADWCGPCKAIAPFYEQLASSLTRPGQITFTKVNTDNQKDITQTYNITAMPTFMVFKNGRETQRIRGADAKALDTAVKSLASEAESSSADASSSSSGTWIGASLPRGYSDITDSVDQLNLDFLNTDSAAGNARVVFDTAQPSAISKAKSTGDKDWIQSDSDDQLMLYIPFQGSLKIHSLHITSFPTEGDDDIVRPRTLKLYSNKSNVLSFDEAESIPETQEITLQDSDWDAKTGTAKVDLRFVKFQNVSSLVIFVVDGDGVGEKTRIDRIKIIGETGEKRAMGKLEKIGDEQGE
ncbi:DUF1000-domain-containing protein [Aureobasidium subglaciale]|nr:DUF1000-domain-containing protein [Aureobasidium subglaciale]